MLWGRHWVLSGASRPYQCLETYFLFIRDIEHEEFMATGDANIEKYSYNANGKV